MKILNRLRIKAATDTGKYNPGEFGYWWTVEKKKKDIEGTVYKGSIDCRGYKLTSLKGCPNEVTKDFACSGNSLTSLEGAPQKVGGDFDCYNNELTSLKGSPEIVGGNFNCSHNKLTSLEGGPKEVYGDFNCKDNDELNLLRGTRVRGKIYINN